MRRTIHMIAAAAIMSFFAIMIGAARASACDLSQHCYAIARSSGTITDGMTAVISPRCLSVAPRNFVTDELWLVQSGSAYWSEAGFLQHGGSLNVGGLVIPGRYHFWASKGPSTGFSLHVFASNVPLAAVKTSIYRSGPNQITVAMGSSTATHMNSMTPQIAMFGSETTANSGSVHGIADFTSATSRRGGVWSSGTGGSVWSTGAALPQTFAWASYPTSFRAGVPC